MNDRYERARTPTATSARIRTRTAMGACGRIAAAAAVLATCVARTALAGDAAPPAPSPVPSLVVSDKAPLGCCCIVPDPASGTPPGCSYGLSEDKCRTAGHVLPKWGSTWTPGKCPAP